MKPTTLFDALHILAEAHTRDDDRAGFVVEGAASTLAMMNVADYVAAWRVVREQLHLQTEPQKP